MKFHLSLGYLAINLAFGESQIEVLNAGEIGLTENQVNEGDSNVHRTILSLNLEGFYYLRLLIYITSNTQ